MSGVTEHTNTYIIFSNGEVTYGSDYCLRIVRPALSNRPIIKLPLKNALMFGNLTFAKVNKEDVALKIHELIKKIINDAKQC